MTRRWALKTFLSSNRLKLTEMVLSCGRVEENKKWWKGKWYIISSQQNYSYCQNTWL